ETLIIAKQKHSFAALRTFLETFKSTKTDQHNQSERLSPQQTAPEIQLSQEDQTRPPESEPPPVPTPVEPQRPLSTQETTLQAPRSQERSAPTPPAQTPQKTPQHTQKSHPNRRRSDQQPKDKILRIDQSRIDRLVDLVGELVVAKNSVPFLARRAEKTYGVKPLAQEILEFFDVINRLSGELQSSIMQVRMMPVSTIFGRFPRLVRDISRKLNKKIRLSMEGGDTEADKNIVELLSDPLIHLVRNSLDHGIEPPEKRQEVGKDPEGEIRLVAFKESDKVIIEIHDDGKGIDPEIMKKKAYEKGIIDEERLESISDEEAIQLIFAAGFSTAKEVSDLSGRGVGMDVVRSAVEQVGGQVTAHSQKGYGSKVRLELPMTMAISRVMLIEQNGSLYGVPLEIVSETIRVSSKELHMIKDQEATLLRGEILPLVRLHERLNLPEKQTEKSHEDLAVLVVRPFGEDIGLVVDNFQKGVDIVIKPLDGILAGLGAYAGGALLGDGRVLLVLNLKELL
ncbi:chemotaxis protein CheA, partial [Magnetococcales bacterium HHB-1]